MVSCVRHRSRHLLLRPEADQVIHPHLEGRRGREQCGPDPRHDQKDRKDPPHLGEGKQLAETDGGDGDDHHVEGIEDACPLDDHVTERSDHGECEQGERADADAPDRCHARS